MRGGVAGGHLRGGLGGIDVPDANYGHRGTTLDRYLLAARALGAFVQPSFIFYDFAEGLGYGLTASAYDGAYQNRFIVGTIDAAETVRSRSLRRFSTGGGAGVPQARVLAVAADACTTASKRGDPLYMACGFRVPECGHQYDWAGVGALDSGGAVYYGLGIESITGFSGGRFAIVAPSYSCSGAVGATLLGATDFGAVGAGSYLRYPAGGGYYLTPSTSTFYTAETWWTGALRGSSTQTRGFRVNDSLVYEGDGTALYVSGLGSTYLPLIIANKVTGNSNPTTLDLGWALWVFEGAGV